MTTRKEFITLLEDDGEYDGKNHLFYTYNGNNYNPKILLVIEKMTAFQKISSELKNNNNTAIICTMGFPNQSLIEGIKQAIKKGIKTCYIGDLDPVSLSIYYTIKHNDLEFKGTKEENEISFISLTKDEIKSIPARNKIKLTDEKQILAYLTKNKLVPELKSETDFLKKGYKVEIEVFTSQMINHLREIVDNTTY